MDLEITMAIVGGFICLDEPAIKMRKQRRVWAKKWLQERNKFSHMPLLKEMAGSEPQDLPNYLRMSETSFQELLQLISGKIKKQNTIMRESVSAEERLVATLQFFATGRSYENLCLSSSSSSSLDCSSMVRISDCVLLFFRVETPFLTLS
ncbi:hypothetical protein NQ314_009487 [Rhamnusium bicolor]|uniref:Uncharacterized protein n=1 Tax=Rhamnusium bicolor TaxID=1586634 RepID=A0AAV8XZ37_9CUCU|nr:hypothetical protein NQ314_009487 [Rhamnusium bicolor]